MQILLMKNRLLIYFAIFMGMEAQAQLNKDTQIAGVQLPLIVNDMYFTRLAWSTGSSQNEFGISVAPSYAFVIDDNWLIGIQATLGV